MIFALNMKVKECMDTSGGHW